MVVRQLLVVHTVAKHGGVLVAAVLRLSLPQHLAGVPTTGKRGVGGLVRLPRDVLLPHGLCARLLCALRHGTPPGHSLSLLRLLDGFEVQGKVLLPLPPPLGLHLAQVSVLLPPLLLLLQQLALAALLRGLLKRHHRGAI